MDKIITTEELALVMHYANIFLRTHYTVGINELMEEEYKNINVVTFIISLLYTDDFFMELLDNPDWFDAITNYLEELSREKILELSDRTLRISSKRPSDLTDKEYKIDRIALDNIFAALRKNIELYKRMYKGKAWVIDSSIGRSARIIITPTRFFHLMGLDEKDFKTGSNLATFDSVFRREDQIKSLMSDRKDLLSVLEKIIDREELVKDAIIDGRLRDVINPRKLRMKNYAFERIGELQHSSGMIFFDKSLASSLGYKTHISSEVLLLSDLIRKFQLEFIFTGFKEYKANRGSLDGETLVIPRMDFKKSMFLDNQLVSISERATSYPIKDFEYSITEEAIGDEPDDQIEYSIEDRRRMALTLLKKMPRLNVSHLQKYLYKKDSKLTM